MERRALRGNIADNKRGHDSDYSWQPMASWVDNFLRWVWHKTLEKGKKRNENRDLNNEKGNQ